VCQRCRHFFGDQFAARYSHRAADGRPPDYSRRFLQPPAIARQRELAGTEYDNGWGRRIAMRRAPSLPTMTGVSAPGAAPTATCQARQVADRDVLRQEPLTAAFTAAARLTVKLTISCFIAAVAP